MARLWEGWSCGVQGVEILMELGGLDLVGGDFGVGRSSILGDFMGSGCIILTAR